MSRLIQPVSPRDHRLGPDGAPAVLVEYGDYECPHSGRAHQILQVVLAQLGTQVQYVFRHFPLTSIHPSAELAAEGAEAASAQGAFWEMHNALFQNQAQLGPQSITTTARQLELDMRRFNYELNQQTHRAHIKQDFMSGVRSGVHGTPTFFINGIRFDPRWGQDTLTSALRLAADLGEARDA